MKLNINEIIVKSKILDSKKVKAIIGLDFGDFVVKGFRIMESEFENDRGEKLWLTPPSYQSGSRYHPIFFVPDKSLWKLLEEKIWDEYESQRQSYNKKKYDVSDKEFDEIF